MPGLKKLGPEKMDKLNRKMMDKIELRHTVFLEYHGNESPNVTTIIPIEIQLNFLGALRQGIGSRFGPSQEFASEWLHPFRVEMMNC